MFKWSIASCVIISVGLSNSGCDGIGGYSGKYGFPRALPLWIVENHPERTIFVRKDLERDRDISQILVIPLYEDYQHEDGTDSLAIAHPFVCQPGEEIEERLASFGQRDKLQSLIVWVPGYFPGSIGRVFWRVFMINEREMIVLELEPCIGDEQAEIDRAMKELLFEPGFVVGKKILPTAPPPPHVDEVRMSTVPYDAKEVVRTMEYNGRFYRGRSPQKIYVLWAFPPGTRIANRLTEEDKTMVAEFAAEAANKATLLEDGGERPDAADNKQ